MSHGKDPIDHSDQAGLKHSNEGNKPSDKITKQPSLLDALIPTVTLLLLLSISVYLFGEDSSYGANQIVLLLSV